MPPPRVMHSAHRGACTLCLLQVVKLLRGLVQVTMLRGAQSAGIATWHLHAKRRPALIGTKRRGVRVRVVNGKRTDLSELLIAKCERDGLFDGIHAQQIFQGHTRFATSSIANLQGCHPHQWCPPSEVRDASTAFHKQPRPSTAFTEPFSAFSACPAPRCPSGAGRRPSAASARGCRPASRSSRTTAISTFSTSRARPTRWRYPRRGAQNPRTRRLRSSLLLNPCADSSVA